MPNAGTKMLSKNLHGNLGSWFQGTMLINTVPSMETNLRTDFSLAEIPLSLAQVDTTIIRAESCHRREGAVVDEGGRWMAALPRQNDRKSR